MKTITFLACCVFFLSVSASGQRYLTKTGYIRFYSDAPLEKIEAHNRSVNAALDATSGDFVFRVLMKSFTFEKALMQEHFNENYVESDKFPNATFLGKVTNIKDVLTDKDGTYPVTVEGKLTIHGITKTVSVKGTFGISKDKLLAKAKFTILLPDYQIEVPGAVVNNISKSIEITVETTLDKSNL
jgi:polyisoprenoid-binding protein YceI